MQMEHEILRDKTMQQYRKPRARYMAKLEGIFDIVEVNSYYLRKLLYQTISTIEKGPGNPELSFGWVKRGKRSQVKQAR